LQYSIIDFGELYFGSFFFSPWNEVNMPFFNKIMTSVAGVFSPGWSSYLMWWIFHATVHTHKPTLTVCCTMFIIHCSDMFWPQDVTILRELWTS
jgi:hypothetical protein